MLRWWVVLLVGVQLAACAPPPARSVLVQTAPDRAELRGERVVMIEAVEAAIAACEPRPPAQKDSCTRVEIGQRLASLLRNPPLGCAAAGDNLICDTALYRRPMPITPQALSPGSAFGRAVAACRSRGLVFGLPGYQPCLDVELSAQSSGG
jgi:hypothetical protein